MSKGKNKQRKDANHRSKSRFFQAYFDSIKGKDVKIYRGGPEAKHGVIVDVQSNYLALAAKDSVIYYQAEHVKSISKPTKPKPPYHEKKNQEKGKEKEKFNFLSAKNFRKLLKKMEHQAIQLNQGGPESIHGLLLSVRHDFLILFSEDDGLVYVNIHHVKSVSLSSMLIKRKEENKKDKLIAANKLFEVFRHLENKWVSINRGGPEAIEGVLFAEDGFYKLTHNEEVIRVDPFHIRSVSFGPKGFMKKDKDKDKHDGKDGKKDKGKHEGKNGKKDGHDDKYKDKNGKRSGRNSGNDRYKDCKDHDDKDDSMTCKRYKDWFDKKFDRKDSGFKNLCDDDDGKNDKDKDDKDKNDNNKSDNKNDSSKNNSKDK